MLNIKELEIEINRGNAADLTLHFEGDDTPADGTTVLFEVRPVDQYSRSVIRKEVAVSDGQVDIIFQPEDTENLQIGNYYWNACIQYYDGQAPWTVMRDWQQFTILPG